MLKEILSVETVLMRSKKPGVVLAPVWKGFCKDHGIDETKFLLSVADQVQGVVATAFVSNNLYICPPGKRPITRLTANIMFHGEIGIDSIFGVREVTNISDHDMKTIDLFSRRIKVVFPDKAVKVGAGAGNLLKHSKKFSPLLDSECDSLSDHAWLACAFSFAQGSEHLVSSGAATATSDGRVFRAGEIEGAISARDAAIVGMHANACEPNVGDDWADCDEPAFKKHRWYSRFLDLAKSK